MHRVTWVVGPMSEELDHLDETWAKKTIQGVFEAHAEGRWQRNWVDGIQG